MDDIIETIPGSGDGRCRRCDLPYSLHDPREVADHAAHHARYERAARAGRAPMHATARERLAAEGLRAQREGGSLDERVAGAEAWLLARHHEHLAQVLRTGSPRLDFRAFFTHLKEQGLEGRFATDVALALHERYSDR